jgi:hypothetical protein
MSRVSLSLRLMRAQDAALRRYADAHGVVRYQAAIRAVEAGLAALVVGGPTRSDQISQAQKPPTPWVNSSPGSGGSNR